MSENPNRRSKKPEAPEAQSGYRSSRRASRAAKQAKSAERKYRVASLLDRQGRRARNIIIVTVQGLALLGMSLLVLLLLASAVNTAVRWNAKRLADRQAEQAKQERVRENLMVVGVEGDRAVGFLAMRIDKEQDRAVGIAIPDGAFIEIPGQGFERIGESWEASATTSLSAVSNYLTVPFEAYIAVPVDVYETAMRGQDVARFAAASTDSNLTEEELAVLDEQLRAVPQKNVALVPMPVKPLKLGEQTYLDPEREAVMDLLKTWWGIDPSAAAEATRVIVYNGAGVPGIAGEAAQQLIRAGFRVVNTKNAERFDYDKTTVVVKRGGRAVGEDVSDALGIGVVTVEPSDTSVTDVVVIIGKDYEAPKEGAAGGDE